MNLLTLRTGALALTTLALAPLARAHGGGEGSEGPEGWGAGLFAGTERKPYRDFDNKTEVLPLLTFENRWVRVTGPGVDFKLGRTGPVSYALTASYAREGYKPGDSPFLEGMDRRKASVWLGGRATFSGDIANVSAAWQLDASGNSKGQKFTLGVERRFAFGDVGITPRAEATWLDNDVVDYYYGVKASEARTGRAAYAGASTVNAGLGLRLDWRVAPGHLLFVDMGATLLGSKIQDSPLVDRSAVPELRLGWMVRF